MFKTYEKISSDTIEAAKSPKPFVLEGVQFAADDYVLQDPVTGAISGMKAEEFDAKYREQKKTWSRKKKGKVEGAEGERAPAEAEVVTEATVGESAAAD